MRVDSTVQNDVKAANITSSKEMTADIPDKKEDTISTDNNSKSFTATSKDGDTLELGTRINDATLAKYSKAKLTQLLSNRQITQQQYKKAIKK